MGTCKRFLEKQKKSDCLLRPLNIILIEILIINILNFN